MIETNAIVVEGGGAPPVLTTVTLAAPRPDEVLVEVAATGICHTDMSWARGLLGERVPAVLGHETSGVVREVGSRVSRLSPGDRVVIGLSHECGRCEYCMTGHPMLCAQRTREHPRISSGGIPIHQGFGVGGFAQHVVVGERSCFLVPDGVPLDVAAVVGCAVATGVGAALNIAKVSPGSRVLVFGVGGIGSSVIIGCVLAGAERIVAVDTDPDAAVRARALGATDAVVPGSEEFEAAIATEFDFVFESVGSTRAMEQAVASARRGGSITLIGAPRPGERLSLPVLDFVVAQKTLHGCLTGDVNPVVDFDRFFRLYQRGRLPLDLLLGDEVSLAEAVDRLDGSAAPTPGRTILRPGSIRDRR